MSVWKKLILVPALAVAVGAATPVLALDQEQLGREPTTNEVMTDALLARPLGLIATGLGALTYVVALPFTLPSGTTDRAYQTLIAEPARYTFKRPIGQMDSCLALPESCK
jgi:hypothetical protein